MKKGKILVSILLICVLTGVLGISVMAGQVTPPTQCTSCHGNLTEYATSSGRDPSNDYYHNGCHVIAYSANVYRSCNNCGHVEWSGICRTQTHACGLGTIRKYYE